MGFRSKLSPFIRIGLKGGRLSILIFYGTAPGKTTENPKLWEYNNLIIFGESPRARRIIFRESDNLQRIFLDLLFPEVSWRTQPTYPRWLTNDETINLQCEND
jgi:hypothetical protein